MHRIRGVAIGGSWDGQIIDGVPPATQILIYNDLRARTSPYDYNKASITVQTETYFHEDIRFIDDNETIKIDYWREECLKKHEAFIMLFTRYENRRK